WFDGLSHPATAEHALSLLMSDRADLELTWLEPSSPQLTGLRIMGLDQSNTTVLTDRHAWKVFRRVRPGRNPETGNSAALRERGCTHAATLSGWITLTTPDGQRDVVAAHRRLDGSNGFDLARSDAQRHAGGITEQHFPSAAYELGIAVGAVHADLADA